MKQLIKILISAVLTLSVLLSLFTVNTLAAGCVISLSTESATVGEAVSVTVTFDAGEAMYAISGIINYDSSLLEYKSGNATGGAGVLRLVESPSGETSTSYTLTFNTLAAGSAGISISDSRYSTLGANGAEERAITGASATVSVKDVTLSDNANLKSMYLSAGTLSPAFSPDVTEYSVTVDKSVTQCKITAVAAESAAKVEVTGSPNLKVGANTRSVIVTAPNGTQKTYTLNITRSETDSAANEGDVTATEEQLKKLQVAIEGVEHTISTDLSTIALFKGFTLSTTQHNGIEIPVAIDGNNEYMIYYLKSSVDEYHYPYTYDQATQTFNKVVYFTQGEFTYILSNFPDNNPLMNNYYSTTATIFDQTVSCFSNSQQPDYYYIYCYNGFAFSYYRYDSFERSLQRFPDIELTAYTDEPVDTEAPKSFAERFNSLSSNSKLLVILILLFVILAIGLIVLLVIRIAKGFSNKDNTDYDYNNVIEFEETSINGLLIEDNDAPDDNADN